MRKTRQTQLAAAIIAATLASMPVNADFMISGQYLLNSPSSVQAQPAPAEAAPAPVEPAVTGPASSWVPQTSAEPATVPAPAPTPAPAPADTVNPAAEPQNLETLFQGEPTPLPPVSAADNTFTSQQDPIAMTGAGDVAMASTAETVPGTVDQLEPPPAPDVGTGVDAAVDPAITDRNVKPTLLGKAFPHALIPDPNAKNKPPRPTLLGPTTGKAYGGYQDDRERFNENVLADVPVAGVEEPAPTVADADDVMLGSGDCVVMAGTLKDNLQNLSAAYGEKPIVWLPKFDIPVPMSVELKASGFRPCVSEIIASLQRSGAPIRAVERDNAIVIHER